ncbi:MAG: hypothetical protein ACRC1T_00710 [Clostridium chrysemydis]|uniref:hypothetical protein n=1 Tax=Clostridium chrysemydis TaxID=2665504 RepID=UPI003F343FA2
MNEIKKIIKAEEEKIARHHSDKKYETVTQEERIEMKKEEIEKGDEDKNKEWELIR